MPSGSRRRLTRRAAVQYTLEDVITPSPKPHRKTHARAHPASGHFFQSRITSSPSPPYEQTAGSSATLWHWSTVLEIKTQTRGIALLIHTNNSEQRTAWSLRRGNQQANRRGSHHSLRSRPRQLRCRFQTRLNVTCINTRAAEDSPPQTGCMTKRYETLENSLMYKGEEPFWHIPSIWASACVLVQT